MAPRAKFSTGLAEVDTENVAISTAFQASNPNHRVEVEWMEIRDMYVDPDIQRGEESGEINRIVSRFNENALGTLVVAHREISINGRTTSSVRSLLDGQQRRAALLLLNYDKPVRVLVHYGLTRAEEARLFLDLNERRSIGAWQKFRTRLTAEEPQAIAIKTVLEECNITMGGAKGFNAIDKADRIFAWKNGRDHLKWALQMVRDIYNDETARPFYDGRVIMAFALLHQHCSRFIDEQRLVEKLVAVGGGGHKLLGYGKTIQDVKRGALEVNIADAIISYYNLHKRRNPGFPSRLPDMPRNKVSTVRLASGLDLEADETEAVPEQVDN